MSNNVDYWISEVCYNSQKTHIEKVKVHKDGNISKSDIWSVQLVINYLRKNYNISTMIKKNGKWIIGAPVEIFNLRGTDYIRTDNDSTAEDNLENLPRFC